MRALCLWCLVAVCSWASAEDWPQWRGPKRDGKSADKGLLQSWPAGGPKVVWSFKEAGFGYGSPAVVGNTIYCLGKDDDGEFIAKIDAEKGSLIKRTKLDDGKNEYLQGWGGGPRSTPTVDGKQVFALSSDGMLACYDVESLEQKWKYDFNAAPEIWGYAESPLVDGDRVIVYPGSVPAKGKRKRGRDQDYIHKGMVALNRNTGEVIWKCEDLKDPPGYASIVPMMLGDKKLYIIQTAKNIAGVHADSGKLAFTFGEIGRQTAVIPTPIVDGNLVYVSAGYGAGCECIELSAEGDKVNVKKVYSNKNMVNHHGGVILHEGKLYGHSDKKGWTCQDLKTGEIAWQHEARDAGKGSIGYADGRFYCFEEKTRGGTCILIEASPKGWKEVGRLKLPENSSLNRGQGMVWPHPVIANGKLYLRDLDLIYCFDVSGK